MKRQSRNKLIKEDVELILQLYGNPIPYGTKRTQSRYPGINHRTLAEKFNVSRRCIQKILQGITWKYVGVSDV